MTATERAFGVTRVMPKIDARIRRIDHKICVYRTVERIQFHSALAFSVYFRACGRENR